MRAVAFFVLLLLGIGLAIVAWNDASSPAPSVPVPVPVPVPIPVKPSPCPGPGPCPAPGPRPRPRVVRSSAGLQLLPVSLRRSSGERKAHVRHDLLTPDGQPVHIEFPSSQHKKNTGGSDGAGLCVFCSASHSGDWSSEDVFYGLFDYMKQFPGGGYPEKVDQMVKRYALEKRLPVPRYIQIEGKETHLQALACEHGYCPMVTYYRSPTGRYGGSRISHMVNQLHNDGDWVGILDNNYPQSVEWIPRDEYEPCYTGGGSGWTVLLLHNGPPPAPWNKGA